MSSENKYLNYDGLTTLWSKIKSYISSLGYTTNKGTVGGSGTSGYLAKWTGTTAVGNGPQLGSSTVTFLRNDGNWSQPQGSITKIQKNGSDLTITNKTVNIGVPTSTSELTNDSGFITDGSKWNDVELVKQQTESSARVYIPYVSSTSSTVAKLTAASRTPYGDGLVKYNSSGYIISTTPTTGTSSSVVATTEFVHSVVSTLTDTTYSAGTGLILSGTTFNHSNSTTAGTVGSTSVTASTGSTVEIPYVTYDAQGHITATGVHKHIVPVSEGGDSNISATVVSGVLILTVESEYEDGTEVGY